MKNTIKIAASQLILLLSICTYSYAQIETTILSDSPTLSPEKAIFFTNRPMVIKKDSTFTFKNKYTRQSNAIHFCSYQYNTDSIGLYYKVTNLSDDYPTGKLEHNFMYDLYNYYRIECGIKNVQIIVGGYGKNFHKQVHSYIKRIKATYGDSLFDNTLISVFAWGNEDDVHQYYHALRASKNGAADFAIFQHMLDEYMSDSVFWANNSKDFKIDISFSSIGNKLFLEYMERREQQGIPLVKTYNDITFLGSVVPRNSFEEGKAFNKLNQMADTVNVIVNSRDVLLKISSVASLKSQMGIRGPKDEENLPGYIKVYHIEDMITKKDMSKLGHDYFLTNKVLQDSIMKREKKVQ